MICKSLACLSSSWSWDLMFELSSAGSTVLSALESSGLDTSGIRRLGNEYHSPRTAHYVAVNEADKHLLVAIADMGIFTSRAGPAGGGAAGAAAGPGGRGGGGSG